MEMARLAYEFLGESPRNEKFARPVPGKKPFLKRKHKKITRIIKKLLTGRGTALPRGFKFFGTKLN